MGGRMASALGETSLKTIHTDLHTDMPKCQAPRGKFQPVRPPRMPPCGGCMMTRTLMQDDKDPHGFNHEVTQQTPLVPFP